jgi:phosphocarrier protein HPr
MLEAEVVLINPLGLHARAAAKLVRIACRYQSKTSITHLGRAADAKSILGVLTLAAPCGGSISIAADGEDEREVIEEIKRLFESGFGEI